MSTDTPSPHRFLVPHPAAAHTPKQKPLSGLRHVLAPRTPKSATATFPTPSVQSRPTTPAKRFVISRPCATPIVRTPTQAKGKVHEVVKDTPTQGPSAQGPPRPTPCRKLERVESIQDSSQSSPEGTQEAKSQDDVLQSIEQEHSPASDTSPARHGEEDEMLFVPINHHKRRRISPSSSPSDRSETAPRTPLAPHTSASHRFKIVPPRTPGPLASIAGNRASSPKPSSPSAPHRPHFLLPPPPTSPPKPTKPLAEIFSPSRKIAKYMPDGLASTMTAWIVETAHTGFPALQRSETGGVVWGREKDDGVKLRVRISHVATGAVSPSPEHEVDEVECFPGGVLFARGDVERVPYHAWSVDSMGEEAGEVKALLAGQGGARGSGGVRVRKGDVVGVRAPVWDLTVAGETWVVGVDWVVL